MAYGKQDFKHLKRLTAQRKCFTPTSEASALLSRSLLALLLALPIKRVPTRFRSRSDKAPICHPSIIHP